MTKLSRKVTTTMSTTRHRNDNPPKRTRLPAPERRETILRAATTVFADPQAAAWLLLSVLSARRLRAAAMPPGLEPSVTALALEALAPPALASPGHDQAPPGAAC
jgi:hypothetical protein